MRQTIKRLPGMKFAARQVQEVLRGGVLRTLPKQSIAAEIGVDRGDFSQRILKVVQPRTLHLIDPWEYMNDDAYKEARYGGKGSGGQAGMDRRFEMVQQRFKSEIAAGQVIIHRTYSEVVGPTFEDDYFDWIYVDGNHLYEYVKRDLEIFYPKLKNGGLIAGDDYVSGGWWQGGVKRAVDEVIAAGQVEVVTLRFGQFVLRKM